MLVECPSICNFIASSILALTKPDDYILIMTPAYSFYMATIEGLNRKVIANPFK